MLQCYRQQAAWEQGWPPHLSGTNWFTFVSCRSLSPVAAGQLALESAVEAILKRFRAAPLLGESSNVLYLSQLHTACTALLRALPPDAVAGEHRKPAPHCCHFSSSLLSSTSLQL